MEKGQLVKRPTRPKDLPDQMVYLKKVKWQKGRQTKRPTERGKPDKKVEVRKL